MTGVVTDQDAALGGVRDLCPQVRGETGGYYLVSEPLNDDTEAWVEIPDGSAVVLGENGVDMRIFSPVGRPAGAMEAKIALVT